ncbi:MAG: ferritin-like domain-containing protein [Acidimicrobiales bacterium]
MTSIDQTPSALAASRLSRRGFIGGAGAIGAGLVLVACGDDGGTSSSGATTTAAASGATATTLGTNNDAKIAMLAAGLEVLAVATYKAALDAAGAGKLGAVPPAVATYATTARDQHQKQLDTWNAVLTKAGAKAIDQPNATLKPTVDAEFAKVTDVTGVARLALKLEQIAAATYLSAIPKITDKTAVELAGSIFIVDMQHAAVLLYVLGEYPVPDIFAKTDLAVAS